MSITYSFTEMESTIQKVKTLNANKKMEELINRVGDVGIQTAKLGLATATLEGNENVAIEDTLEKTENGARVVAIGSQVAFVEFGYGIPILSSPHPMATQNGNNFVAGSWSDDESLGGKHHWNNPNGWYYAHDKKSYGMPPQRFMLNASQEMKRAMPQIAKEVFKQK